MRRIGLIGGMSWESTAVYYRLLNEGVRQLRGDLASADVLVHSLDFSAVVALQRANRWDEAAALLAASAQGLERAGARCILIGTNTMHLVADAVQAAVQVPLVDIVAETGRRIAEAGYRRPLLLATRYTMEHGFYHARMARAAGIGPVVPDEEDRALVHRIIFEELCAGRVLDGSRRALERVVERGREAGADSVILGCTEICLSLDPAAQALPGFDSTTIHAEAALRFALCDGRPASRPGAAGQLGERIAA